MSNVRELERAELHKTIRPVANDLCGSVYVWDFKSYELGILFYCFISENLTAYPNPQEYSAGDKDFDCATLRDADADQGRTKTVKQKGFYILPSQAFANVRQRARHDANLNKTLSRAFTDVEGSAIGANSKDDFEGLFDDPDVNSSRLGPTVARRNEKLVKLPAAMGDLPLKCGSGSFSADTIELLIDTIIADLEDEGPEEDEA